MTLLVTGATGFVMAVLGRHWLEADPEARLVVLDSSPLDAAAQRYFAPVMKRLSVVIADVTQAETWQPALARHGITHLVHGATITPLARGTVAEVKREPEAGNPARILDVNVMGTVAMLEWARTLPNLKRFIYVSSGAVYKHHGPDRPGEPRKPSPNTRPASPVFRPATVLEKSRRPACGTGVPRPSTTMPVYISC